MRITAVETFVLTNRRLLVKISTDAGITGWGEPTLEGWVRPAAATVEQMAEYLIGQDPRRITHHGQVLSRGGFYRGGAVVSSAIAGIDQALWDILGRSLNAPVHELLGGAVRDSVRLYAHANTDGRSGDPVHARTLIDAGYTMLKVAPGFRTRFLETEEYTERFVEDLTEFRAAIGSSIDFGIDLHGRFSVAQSRRTLPMIERLNPAFVEEPLRPEHSALIGSIVASTSIPIATGERLYSRMEFRSVLESGVAIVQPDLAHAGGISECMRIASQAEIYDAQLAPHCPLGPVALAACLQVDLAVPNFLAQESVVDLHNPDAGLGLQLLLNPEVLKPVNGYVPRLTGPGMGIEINEDAVRAAVVVAGPLDGGVPVWFDLDDGSFLDW